MAEGESKISQVIDLTGELKDKGDALECAVCLQTCIHPAQLPCGHIFCFLCIKGIANQSKKCAMCRHEIPRDFIEHPNLLQTEIVEETPLNHDGTFQWFYEGRNGWWQYDERTSKELEASYKAGERICELLIAGFLYVADLETMLQIRRNDPSRRRRIKRDLANIPKKGIAGLRTDEELSNQEQETQYPEAVNNNGQFPIEGSTNSNAPPTPTTPSNTPQSPTSGRESPQQNELEATVQRIQALNLQERDCDDYFQYSCRRRR